MSVATKLQVKNGRTLAVENAPADFDLALFADAPQGEYGKADVVLLFTPDRASLELHLTELLASTQNDAILWVAYPKLTSMKAGDLNRDVIHNLVPAFKADVVSQVAIDEDWSALRLKRLAQRALDYLAFADALHLGAADGCEVLFSFDRKFAKAAAGCPVTVVEP